MKQGINTCPTAIIWAHIQQAHLPLSVRVTLDADYTLQNSD